MSPIIEARNIFKIFGDNPELALDLLNQGKSKAEVQAATDHVIGLNNVSLSVERGEIFVVMGLSGSGKSTFIRHINRLIDPTSGEVFVNGASILDLDMQALREFRRHQLAMVFQNFGLMPHRSVVENVAYGLEIRGVGKAERLVSAEKWIERVGLKGYEKAQPRELSGGQQQRVGLARALAMDTDILLMDEAFSALDPLIRSEMQDELVSLQQELNKTILFITHDFDEAVKIGDRIAILNDGAIVQTGKPGEIVLNPADDYVSAFVGGVNKARVIQMWSIMEPGSEAEGTEVQVSRTTSCEDVLPLFAEHDRIGIVDDHGAQVGSVTARSVIKALARYQN